MPNWVFNHLTIDGSKEDIAKVKAQVGAVVKTKYKGVDEVDELVDREPIFSFMNILPPPEDKLDEYHAVHGYTGGEKTGDTEYNWYNFNVREWGTKWDARDVDLLEEHKKQLSLNTFLHSLNMFSNNELSLISTQRQKTLQLVFSQQVHQKLKSLFLSQNATQERLQNALKNGFRASVLEEFNFSKKTMKPKLIQQALQQLKTHNL